MRNWNSVEVKDNIFFDELRAYLWGIETFFSFFFNLIKSCCEPTYEELKPSKSTSPSLFSFSCEPTYEELKHPNFYTKLVKFLSCEPTYEELKLDLLWKILKNLKMLRAYLWGIETI